MFGLKLSEIESHLFKNIKKTKIAFPQETQSLECGLALMFDLTQAINETIGEMTKPQLYTNMNLFARNRQLLLNAYFCFLCSNYGTQFVILRVVFENNNLMRLFKLHPQYAFEWLPSEKQKTFSPEIQLEYGKSGIKGKKFGTSGVMGEIFKNGKQNVEKRTKKTYDELCNYTHPNFKGWRELMGVRGGSEVVLNMPAFWEENALTAIGITLYMMQLSFKTFVETFRDYAFSFAVQINEWKNNNNNLILRYME